MKLIEQQLALYEEEYKKFMGTNQFPKYELQFKEVSLNVADNYGFDSVAFAAYQTQTNKHTLVVSTNLKLSKHVVFHEFTHIYDSYRCVKGDKVRYAGLSSFTEYHASQVELMQLLNVENIDDSFTFSMDSIINTISGKKSVKQYIDERQQHAIDLFERKDFPANLETLKSALGILYNYFGLRSICEMYAIDYKEKINNEAFLKYISILQFCPLNNLMHGWLDEKKIDQSIELYVNIIFPLIEKFKLA